MRILAIDPGTTQSGWVIVRVENDSIIEIEDKGISDNLALADRIDKFAFITDKCEVWCEMIASQGMSVGQETFETCVWIGRFLERAWPKQFNRATRNQIKLHICGTARAKDPNVTQALKDRFGAPGTKKEPGFTYGITSHMWQALAVAAYAVDYNAGRVK